MKVLGISAFYHDSAAVIIEDGRVVLAAQEERFSGIKNDAAFPSSAIQFCLKESKTELSELKAIVFYDKPFLKFERILETYLSQAPKGLVSFLKSMPIWIKDKLYIKRTIRQGLLPMMEGNGRLPKIYFPEHHLSHAASAYYPSGFDEALILTVDGVGEYTTTSLAVGKGNSITQLRTMAFPDSLGLLYAAFTYYLGFRINSGEYKVMGLSSYGDSKSKGFKDYYWKIKESLIQIHDDGSFKLNRKYFGFLTGLRMTKDKHWENLFGIKRRIKGEAISSKHQNLAKAIQVVTEEIFLKIATEGKRLTDCTKICLAGGVALNCVANGVLVRSGLFESIYIQPAAGDAGGAIGAALAYYHLSRPEAERKKTFSSVYLGPNPGAGQKEKAHSFKENTFSDFDLLCEEVSSLLSQGKVIGWVQGRMEFGPRALGNRSILADPRKDWMQDRINLKVKNREEFRPFAPVVLEEDAHKYFDTGEVKASPFMLVTFPVIDQSIPAVTHVDGSARVQTVNQEQNEKLFMLLKVFKETTGCSVLLNTSLNGKDQPIACGAEEALTIFAESQLDYLVIKNTIFSKEWN
ncbi:MAG: hypothetical protein HKN16_07055 [Saprospiraceae bacterium]|nr:hypothetical protein [Saprospiraceae bacterium]